MYNHEKAITIAKILDKHLINGKCICTYDGKYRYQIIANGIKFAIEFNTLQLDILSSCQIVSEIISEFKQCILEKYLR